MTEKIKTKDQEAVEKIRAQAEKVVLTGGKKTNEASSKTAGKDKPIIELSGVNKNYKVGRNIVNVLKNVNFKIYPREFVVILGPSGSGKSTLLNALLGLEYPSSGKVMVENEEMTKMSINELAKFRFKVYGIVFQRADWVRSLSVIHNIALPLSINNRPKKERMEIAWRLIKEVGMEDHANYFPSELSGGQQQKIVLARALVNDPNIIVADEPTGNLDTVSADRVMNLFKDLNEKRKKTIIMVTHNIDYVRYGTKTIYVRDGQIVDSSAQFGL